MKNIKGFGHPFLIIIIAIAVIAGVGWYTYSHNNKNSKPTESSSSVKLKTYTDSSQTYRFEYPENWELTEGIVDTFSNIKYLNDTDLNLIPPDALPRSKSKSPHTKNGVSVAAFENEPSEILKALGQENSKPQSLKINGFPALFLRTTMEGALQLVIDLYLISHNNITVQVDLTEKQTVHGCT